MRDLSGMFAAGVCVICQQPRTDAGQVAHVAHHLATAEAIVELEPRGTERVVPNVGQSPRAEIPADFFRRMDPKLRKLAMAALKRSAR